MSTPQPKAASYLWTCSEQDVETVTQKYHDSLYSYNQKDYDPVDRLLDKIKKWKNNLILFIKKAAAKEDVKRKGKELLKLLFYIIKDSQENKVDLNQIIAT